MSYEKTHPPLASLRPGGAHPCLRRDTHMAHAQTFNPGMIPITFPFRVPFCGCPLWPCPVSDRPKSASKSNRSGSDRSLADDDLPEGGRYLQKPYPIADLTDMLGDLIKE